MAKYFFLPKDEGFYRKRGIIYVSFRHDGQKHTFSTGTTGQESNALMAIREFKKNKLIEVGKNGGPAKAFRGTVSELFKDYVDRLQKREAEKGEYATGERRTSDRTDGFIKNHLERFFGKMHPKDVAGSLDAYKAKREKEGATPATVNGEFRVLSAAMRRGWKNNKVHSDHLPKEYPFNHDGEKKSARTGTITPEQIACISANAAPHLKSVFLTAIYTGLRPKEIRWLTVDNVILDGDDPIIVATHHKNQHRTNKPKKVSIPDALLPTLQIWRAYSSKEYPKCPWFFHLNGSRLGEWKTAWAGVLRRCNIEPGSVKFYDARRTHASMLRSAGVDMADIRENLGHAPNSPVTGDYIQVTPHTKNIREKLRKGNQTTPVQSSAPAASKGDWKAELMELKEAFDSGLLPEDVYKAEVGARLESGSQAARRASQ